MFNVAIQKYNSDDWKWITLPCENIEEHLGGWLIVDFECEHFNARVSEFTNLIKLNELAEILEGFSAYDLKVFGAIIEADTSDPFDALETFESQRYVFYEVEDLEELAEIFVEEVFGDTLKGIESYIDYKSIGRDLNYSGYTETSYGIIIFL